MWIVQVVHKEFLSLKPIVILGFLAIGVAIAGLHTGEILAFFSVATQPVYPFLGVNFEYLYFLVGYALAIIVGYWQTLWEFSRGTWLFLMHRPRSFEQIILAKLLAGILIVMAMTAIPAILYGIYISIPGVLPAPFEWTFTGQFWRCWLLIPVVQTGAFLSGMRDGRWYVSRLLPFVTSCFLAILIFIFGCYFWLLIMLLAIALLLQFAALRQEILHRDFS